MEAKEIFKGLGTSDNPYLIQNEIELFALADSINQQGKYKDYIGKHFLLTEDIKLTKPWTPIAPKILGFSAGKYNCGFCGIFDGGGHVISNMDIKEEGGNGTFTGFIGLLQGIEPDSGVVRNLGVKGKITVRNFNGGSIGAIAGIIHDGVVENCYTDIEIVATELKEYPRIGGITGGVQNNSKLCNCYASGSILVKGGKPEVGYVYSEQRSDRIAYWDSAMKAEAWDADNNQLSIKKSGFSVARDVMTSTTKHLENTDKTFLQLLNEQVSGKMLKWTQKDGCMPAFGGEEAVPESPESEMQADGIVPPNLWLQEENGTITACYPKEQYAPGLFRSQGIYPLCGVFSLGMVMLYYTGINLLNRKEKPLDLDLDQIQPLDIADAMNKANGEPAEEHSAKYNTSNIDSILSFMTDWSFTCKDRQGQSLALKIKEAHIYDYCQRENENERIRNIICQKSPLYTENGPSEESGYKLVPLMLYMSTEDLKDTERKLTLPGYKGLIVEKELTDNHPKDHYISIIGYYKDYLICLDPRMNDFQHSLFLMKIDCLKGNSLLSIEKVDIIQMQNKPFKIGYTKDYDSTAPYIDLDKKKGLEFVQVYSSSQKNLLLDSNRLSLSLFIKPSIHYKYTVDIYSLPDDSDIDINRYKESVTAELIDKYVKSGVSLHGEMKVPGFTTLESNPKLNHQSKVDSSIPLYSNILVKCCISPVEVSQQNTVVLSTRVSSKRKHGFFKVEDNHLKYTSLESSSEVMAFPMSISCGLKSEPENILIIGI